MIRPYDLLPPLSPWGPTHACCARITQPPPAQLPPFSFPPSELLLPKPCADITPGLLAPMNGTPQRYRVQTFMNYLALEIHSVIKPLLLSEVCGGAIPDAVRQYMLEQLKSRLSYVETEWLKVRECESLPCTCAKQR